MKPLFSFLLLILFLFITSANAKLLSDTLSHTLKVSVSGEYLFRIDGGGLADAIYEVKTPLYKSEGLLTKANFIKGTLDAEISPVTLGLRASLKVAPLAFLVLGGGGFVAGGWNAGPFVGMGVNTGGPRAGTSFDEALVRIWGDAALQFETGGLLKNLRANFQLYAQSKVEFQQSSSALSDTTAWIFQDDRGTNMNGSRLFQTYFVGHKLPLCKDASLTSGILAESWNHSSHKNDSPQSAPGWASDFIDVKFGPVLSYVTNARWAITAGYQWRKEREYTDGTTEESRNLPYFKNRIFKKAIIIPYRIFVCLEKQL